MNSPNSHQLSDKLRFIVAICIFLLSFIISSYSITQKNQLELMDGMAEEYFVVAYNLHTRGEMYPANAVDAKIFRPPGYIYFLATVFKIGGVEDMNTLIFPNQAEADKYFENMKRMIYIAQAILLGLTAVILFWWMQRFTGVFVAITCALLVGLNPYTIILTGLIHYDILHIFFLMLASYTLALSVEHKNPSQKRVWLAGLLWGLTTLIRPMTIIFPVFALMIFVCKFRHALANAGKAFVIFCLGMFMVIVPYTIHNYNLTNKFVIVNAQGGVALWAATTQQTKPSANHYNWWDLWNGEGMRVYEAVSGSRDFDTEAYINNVLSFEDEFRKRALENLKSNPQIFVGNVVQNFKTFNLDINSIFLKIFQCMQVREKSLEIKDWLELGNPQNFHSSTVSRAFSILIMFLQVLSLVGILMACKQRDTFLLVPGLVYLCLSVAHSITYMDLMYYYVKIPFLAIFSTYCVAQFDRYKFPIKLRGAVQEISCATVVNTGLVVYVIGLSIVVLI